jgi:hypothetical protein
MIAEDIAATCVSQPRSAKAPYWSEEMAADSSNECPFCGELIDVHAIRCKYCQELLGPPGRESVLDDQADVEMMLGGQADSLAVAYLRGAELRGAILSGMDLFDAGLAAADLRNADLGEANLCSADLRGADLSGANLYGADLSDAKLGGADLSGATLINADLNGAIYDSLTRWPNDFDPVSAGAIDATGAEVTL